MNSKFAFFDFDDTVSRGDSIITYLLYCRKLGICDTVHLLKTAGAFLLKKFHRGGTLWAKETALSFLKEMPVQKADELARSYFQDVIMKKVFPQAVQAMEDLRKQGYTLIMVTASVDAYMRIVPEFFPVAYVLATECMQANGRYTGRVGTNCKNAEKEKRIRSFLEQNAPDYDLSDSVAYGNSMSDLYMLRMVKHPRLIDPPKQLRIAFPDAPVLRWH